jgi:hypothetical protein
MIKKFIDQEQENTFVFIESGERLIMWINGKCEYTFTEMQSIPATLEEAYRVSGLNIWYPMEEI